MNEKRVRKMALELDRMSRSVTSEEAEILDAVLIKTKEHRPLSKEEADHVTRMYDRYLALREEGQDGPAEPEEEARQFEPDEADFDGE